MQTQLFETNIDFNLKRTLAQIRIFVILFLKELRKEQMNKQTDNWLIELYIDY